MTKWPAAARDQVTSTWPSDQHVTKWSARDQDGYIINDSAHGGLTLMFGWWFLRVLIYDNIEFDSANRIRDQIVCQMITINSTLSFICTFFSCKLNQIFFVENNKKIQQWFFFMFMFYHTISWTMKNWQSTTYFPSSSCMLLDGLTNTAWSVSGLLRFANNSGRLEQIKLVVLQQFYFIYSFLSSNFKVIRNLMDWDMGAAVQVRCSDKLPNKKLISKRKLRNL